MYLFGDYLQLTPIMDPPVHSERFYDAAASQVASVFNTFQRYFDFIREINKIHREIIVNSSGIFKPLINRNHSFMNFEQTIDKAMTKDLVNFKKELL